MAIYEKFLGFWTQIKGELSGKTVKPVDFVNKVFVNSPFSACEFILNLFNDDWRDQFNWLTSVASLCDGYNIRLYIMVAFDMAKESDWVLVQEIINSLKTHSSIYSIGIDAEHTKLMGHINHEGFTRFNSMMDGTTKQFINYYTGGAPNTNVLGLFKWLWHTGWCAIGHRRTLYESFASHVNQMGCSARTWEVYDSSYPDADQPNASETYKETHSVGWNPASIRYMLQIGYTHNDDVRQCLLFSNYELWTKDQFYTDVAQIVQELGINIQLSGMGEAPPPPTYPCPVCGQDFSSQEDLTEHLTTHEEPPTEYPCPTCGMIFTKVEALNAHIAEQHPEPPPDKDDTIELVILLLTCAIVLLDRII